MRAAPFDGFLCYCQVEWNDLEMGVEKIPHFGVVTLGLRRVERDEAVVFISSLVQGEWPE